MLGGFWEVKSIQEGRKGGKKGEKREDEETRVERSKKKRKKGRDGIQGWSEPARAGTGMVKGGPRGLAPLSF